MERCRVELITVEELFVDAENIEDACQWARNFIASQTVGDALLASRYLSELQVLRFLLVDVYRRAFVHTEYRRKIG
jgi:hypothetical protein